MRSPILGLRPNLSHELVTPTGATTARTLASRFADVVNVKDYGATGDGTTDDTAAIQAAIDAAKAVVDTISGTIIRSVTAAVFIPSATYILNTGLLTYQSVLITGASQGSVVLEYTGTGGDAITFSKDTTEELYALQIENLILRNTGTGSRGIFADDIQEAQAIRVCGLRRVSVIGFDENISIADSWTFATEQCHFSNAGSYNARIKNATAQHHLNTRFDVAGIDSVLIENSTDNTTTAPVFEGCTFQGAQRWGCRAVDPQSIEFYGCFFEDNSNEDATFGGLKVEDSAGTVIRKIVVIGGHFTPAGGTAGHGAISIDRAQDVLIDTTVLGFTGVGITLGANVQNARLYGVNLATTKVSSSATRLTKRFNDESWDIAEPSIIESIKSAAEFSLPDDAATNLEFDIAGARGILAIAGNSSAAEHGLVAFRVGGSAHVSVIGGTANVTGTTGVLTGTTGIDGDLTIATTNTDNKLYIENRTGAQRSYTLTLLSVGAGRIVAVP